MFGGNKNQQKYMTGTPVPAYYHINRLAKNSSNLYCNIAAAVNR